MDYRKFGDTCYIRIDKGEEVISTIKEICRKEAIRSAVYTGIGGCSRAEIQTFIPEEGSFETECLEGMQELISLNGNIIEDENGELFHHTHAAFSYKVGDEHRYSAGHMKSITVLYTAEIELRPVKDSVIKRKYDPETGTGFWAFE